MRMFLPARVWAAALVLACSLGIPPFAHAAEESLCVAVLPFEGIAARQEDTFLQAGFAETLTTALSRSKSLRVIERGQLKEVLDELKLQNSGLVDEANAKKLGGLLGADRLVMGAFQRSGSSMRVTCRLVDAETGQVDGDHSVAVTRALASDDDLFKLQDEVVVAVLKSFGAEPTPQEQTQIAQVVQGTTNREAYSYYVQAREEYLALTAPSLRRAAALFEKATQSDPSYALAWAGLAETLAVQGVFPSRGRSSQSRALVQRAVAAAEKAMSLGPNLSETHRAFAAVLVRSGHKDQALRARAIAGTARLASGRRAQALRARAIAAVTKALALNDRDVDAHVYLWMLSGSPLSGAGSEHIRRALELNPRHFPGLLALGQRLKDAKRQDEALAIFQRAVEASPRNGIAARGLAELQVAKGDRAAAIATIQRFIEAASEDPAAKEHITKAREDLARLRQSQRTRPLGPRRRRRR